MLDPLLRRIKYETGAFVALYKPYAERYIGILEGLLENPPDETPGWHASELETSQVMAHNPPSSCAWTARRRTARRRRRGSRSFLKKDGAPDVEFDGYQSSRSLWTTASSRARASSATPMTATAEKGEEALERFADHLVSHRRVPPARGRGDQERAFEDRV